MNINQVLDRMPGEIARLSETCEESRQLWQEAKEDVKREEAKLHLSIKAKKPDMTVADLTAEVNASDTIYQLKMAVIAHESQYRKEEAQIKARIEALQSAKMLGRLQMADLANTDPMVKKEY